MELLAPAGSFAAAEAAVAHGADAVYLGFGQFNARRNAKNLTEEEFARAVALCHANGVRVYLTLNTLLTDQELAEAADCVRTASALGADAVLVQDLGALSMVRQTAPDLPVHASTQMSIHNLDGALWAAKMGIRRVVLARELPKDQIAYICARSPVEIEVFVHGALCMCYSGQCYFSSVLGGRSGNRGLCAQPCRLPYGYGKKAEEYPLSLKDMSLVSQLEELREMGVACIKLEGRMKRPEYVSVVTSIYARALKDGTPPGKAELSLLRSAFSRQGFTAGYYEDKVGRSMLGVRDRASKAAFCDVKEELDTLYRRPPISLSGKASFALGRPSTLTVRDGDGNQVTIAGPTPEAARGQGTARENILRNLQKTGGTPYVFQTLDAQVAPGLFFPAAGVNQLRRNALAAINAQRVRPPRRRTGVFHPPAPIPNRKDGPGLTFSVQKIEQLTESLLKRQPLQVYLPLEEAAAHPEQVDHFLALGAPLAVVMPRVLWDREWDTVWKRLDAVKAMGIETALTGNLGQIAPLQDRGFRVRGDFGLNCYNSATLNTLKEQNLASATLSFELRFAQIRDMAKCMDTEVLVYGRLPLMVTEQCIIRNRKEVCGCQTPALLQDRIGARFPVIREQGCRNVILNANTLFLADRQAAYQQLGLWAARLFFTIESPEECVRMADRYLQKNDAWPKNFTRGLYYRDVE
jgi:putative protease